MLDEKLLSRMLVDEDIYTKEEFSHFLHESERTHENLESYLLRKKYLSVEKMYELLARVFNLSFISSLPEEIPDEILFLIPEGFAISHSLLAYKQENGKIYLATSNPNSLSLMVRDYIATLTKLSPKIAITTPVNIQKKLKKYPPLNKHRALSKVSSIQPQKEKEIRAPRTLTELGIFKHTENRLKQMLSARPGIIFITGPKNSGKTTLLQTLLNHFKKKDHVIYSFASNPVHVDPEISQIKRQKSVEDYVSLFSSLLRGDSTLFLVDGLYDISIIKEALRAAESGRTVLLSWEAPTLGSAFLELNHKGIPFPRFRKSITLAIETHTLERICRECIKPVSPIGYEGKGCSLCSQTGKNGSIGVFEIELPNNAPKLLLSLENDIRKKIELGCIAHDTANAFL